MKVLVISHKYPPAIGGMENHCFQLVKALEQASDVDEVHKIILGENESRVSFFWNLKSRVKQMLSDHPDIDVIYLNDGLMAAVSSFLFKITEIPVVATFHGLDVVFPSAYFQQKVIPRLHQLSAVIAVSEATRQECIYRGFTADQVITIPNGVDHELARFDFDTDIRQKVGERLGVDLRNKKVLVTLGRPVQRKGFSWFAEQVMPKLADDVIFLMIGPRSEKKSLLTRVLGLLPIRTKKLIELFLGHPSDEWKLRELSRGNDRIFELGKLPFSEVLSLLHASDLFVMPNIRVDGDAEGFGLVALEAAICQTTVIASGIEGITEAIHHGQNGILVNSADVDAWVETINAQLSDPEKNRSFGQRAKEYTIQSFGWERMTRGYIEFFKTKK